MAKRKATSAASNNSFRKFLVANIVKVILALIGLVGLGGGIPWAIHVSQTATKISEKQDSAIAVQDTVRAKADTVALKVDSTNIRTAMWRRKTDIKDSLRHITDSVADQKQDSIILLLHKLLNSQH